MCTDVSSSSGYRSSKPSGAGSRRGRSRLVTSAESRTIAGGWGPTAARKKPPRGSIAQARSVGDDWCLADALGTIGSIYPLVGEYERGRAAGEEGLALARGRGDLQGMRMSLFGLALTARRAGDGRTHTSIASAAVAAKSCRRKRIADELRAGREP